MMGNWSGRITTVCISLVSFLTILGATQYGGFDSPPDWLKKGPFSVKAFLSTLSFVCLVDIVDILRNRGDR